MTDARTLTQALRGKWYRRYGLAFCPAHQNTRTPALSLANGDDGRLLASCKAGCSFGSVLTALRGLGLIEGGGAFVAPDPAQQARRMAEERAEADKRAAQAQRLWEGAAPISGTLVETYLRARGITAPLPDSLRFDPSCWHATARRFPAMVAKVEGAGRFAVHRTYLRDDGTGKADVDPAKAMLGAVAGGAVRLSEASGPLVLAEGIETALSLASGLVRGPVTLWAALSASGLRAVRLPPDPSQVIIATDGDRAGREAAQALAAKAHAQGWAVSLLPAPEGADWNDVLMGKAVSL